MWRNEGRQGGWQERERDSLPSLRLTQLTATGGSTNFAGDTQVTLTEMSCTEQRSQDPSHYTRAHTHDPPCLGYKLLPLCHVTS